jgi:hypothetical protein
MEQTINALNTEIDKSRAYVERLRAEQAQSARLDEPAKPAKRVKP